MLANCARIRYSYMYGTGRYKNILTSHNPSKTTAIRNLGYAFERRGGEARFYEGHILELNDLDGVVKVQISFEGGNQVLLGRLMPRSPRPEKESAESTVDTMSPEDRQELVNLASATDEERTAILSSENLPFIDLALFSAEQFGVSRKHAVLHWDGKYVTLTDLKSTNGTRLNGSLLYPLHRRIVRNDDQLQLGALQLRVNFRRPEKGSPSGAEDAPL